MVDSATAVLPRSTRENKRHRKIWKESRRRWKDIGLTTTFSVLQIWTCLPSKYRLPLNLAALNLVLTHWRSAPAHCPCSAIKVLYRTFTKSFSFYYRAHILLLFSVVSDFPRLYYITDNVSRVLYGISFFWIYYRLNFLVRTFFNAYCI